MKENKFAIRLTASDQKMLAELRYYLSPHDPWTTKADVIRLALKTALASLKARDAA